MDDPTGPRISRRVAIAFAASTLGGLALRWAYVLVAARDRPLDGDAAYYHGLARVLADGQGFVEPLVWAVTGAQVESATHPPLFPVLLAVPSALGLDTPLAHRLVTSLVGVAVVPLAGVLAHRLADGRAAVLAAVAAALNPAFWMNDVNVLSEALLAPLVAVVLLVAVAAAKRPSLGIMVALGAGIGLATLTRGETLLLLVLVGVPVAWSRARLGPSPPVRLAVAGLTVVGVLAPWTAYNLGRFDEPVLLSNNLGGTLASANCERVYAGPRLGWWELGCHDDAAPLAGDESVRDRALRARAQDYVADHLTRVPLVVAARVGRIWNVYRPLDTARLDGVEGRGRWPARAGLASFAVVAAAAAVGAVDLRRRGVPIAWLLGPLILVTLTAAAFYGSPRFRVPADVALTVAAGVGLARAPTLLRRRHRRAPAASRPPAPGSA